MLFYYYRALSTFINLNQIFILHTNDNVFFDRIYKQVLYSKLFRRNIHGLESMRQQLFYIIHFFFGYDSTVCWTTWIEHVKISYIISFIVSESEDWIVKSLLLSLITTRLLVFVYWHRWNPSQWIVSSARHRRKQDRSPMVTALGTGCSKVRLVSSPVVIIILIFLHAALEATQSLIISVDLIYIWMKLLWIQGVIMVVMGKALMICMSDSIAWHSIDSRRFIKIWLLVSNILCVMAVWKDVVKFTNCRSLKFKFRQTLSQL